MSLGGSVERLLEWPSEQSFSITRREIIAWWEARRLRFNLYIGTIGTVTWFLVLIAGSAAVKPGVDFEEPVAMLVGPFVYGLLANVCYTFGWVVDTVSYHGTPRTRLYNAGIIFSVVLTGLPGVWAVVAWLMTLISGHKLG
jgi:hypothetical protein